MAKYLEKTLNDLKALNELISGIEEFIDSTIKLSSPDDKKALSIDTNLELSLRFEELIDRTTTLGKDVIGRHRGVMAAADAIYDITPRSSVVDTPDDILVTILDAWNQKAEY